MGVYIPKMEKPTDCGDCDFYRWGYCHIKHSRVECEDGVDADCPLIEVTEPHGRLIDESRIKTVYGEAMTTRYQGYISRTEKITHTDAPTIIEAEGK